MSSTSADDRKAVDALLKAMLLFRRATESALENGATAATGRSAVSGSKFKILKVVYHRGPHTLGEVARFLGVSDAAASQLADTLEERRLVRRRADRGDRRTALIHLTPTGVSYVQAVERQQRKRVRAALKATGLKNAAQWARRLEGFARGLTTADSVGDGFCLQCAAYGDGRCVLDDGDNPCRFHSYTERRKARAARRPAQGKRRPASAR